MTRPSVRASAAPADKLSALEMLRQENELLRQTLNTSGEPAAQAGPAVAVLEKTNGATKATAVVMEMKTAVPALPEDYWTPTLEVPDNMEYVDEYGPISAIPDHDGTPSFKYDNTLWAAAEHFKVGAFVLWLCAGLPQGGR